MDCYPGTRIGSRMGREIRSGENSLLHRIRATDPPSLGKSVAGAAFRCSRGLLWCFLLHLQSSGVFCVFLRALDFAFRTGTAGFAIKKLFEMGPRLVARQFCML